MTAFCIALWLSTGARVLVVAALLYALVRYAR